VGTIISIIRINLFISVNYFPAVEKLNNGLDGRSFKLNENIFTAELIKINFSRLSHTYLMIEVRLKIGKY
jgi:hypothetical protein